MLAACFDADLIFFNDNAFKANSVEGGTPRTAAEVLKVCEEVHARGRTSMAAALDWDSHTSWPVTYLREHIGSHAF